MMIDAKDLLNEDETSLWLTLGVGTVGSELETVGRGQRNLCAHSTLPLSRKLREAAGIFTSLVSKAIVRHG
jgi:hypothetical protein